MKGLKLLAALLPLSLTACWSVLTEYPSTQEIKTVYVSPEAAGEYSAPRDEVVPDAQVLIGLSSNEAMITPGLLRVIDLAKISSSNARTYQQLKFLKTAKFDTLVKTQLLEKLKQENVDLQVIEQNKAKLKLVPYVFISASKNDFYLDFTVAVDMNNKRRQYRYRSKDFKTIENIDEQTFNQVATKSFDKVLSLLVMDLKHQIDFSTNDLTLQEKCSAISGKQWGQQGLLQRMNYRFVKNNKNLCIANIEDNFGGGLTTYPYIYIVD